MCDYCGKEITETNKFTLPIWEYNDHYAYDGKGSKVAWFGKNELVNKEQDICQGCQVKIAYLLTLVNQTELSDDGQSVKFTFEQ